MPSFRLRSLTTILSRTAAPLPNSDRNFESNSFELFDASSNPFDVRISNTLRPKASPTASRTVFTSTEENALSAANLWSGLKDLGTDSKLSRGLVQLESLTRMDICIISYLPEHELRDELVVTWVSSFMYGSFRSCIGEPEIRREQSAEVFAPNDFRRR